MVVRRVGAWFFGMRDGKARAPLSCCVTEPRRQAGASSAVLTGNTRVRMAMPPPTHWSTSPPTQVYIRPNTLPYNPTPFEVPSVTFALFQTCSVLGGGYATRPLLRAIP